MALSERRYGFSRCLGHRTSSIQPTRLVICLQQRFAIARVKEALDQGWCQNPTGLFINSCKSGAKGKNTVTTEVSRWFEWARQERIAIAMSGGMVYTFRIHIA